MIGTSLGPYKILEPLGAGGMGEVYLAEDTRLGRKVAIKVLPAEFASDPERLARFEQEARAAAALNHPHIAVVHDIGFEEGAGVAEARTDPNMAASAIPEAGLHYIVQEHLDGETLREPLTKGALPIAKALLFGREVAEGLSAAHEAGIVHRDLKPGNIFITKDGHAKILDFGLAKLTEAAGGEGKDLSMSPTALGTVAGQVMGTAGYMSPEQIQAESEIDGRADIFAFGCLLYEMTAGKRAFAGETVLDTLHSITRTEPQPIGEIKSDIPADLERIVSKCLAKDRSQRYQHAADLLVDLKALGAQVEAGTAEPASATRIEAPRARTAGLSWKVAAPAALAIALGAALATWMATSTSPPPVQSTRFVHDLPQGTLVSNSVIPLALSHDGSMIVIAAVGEDGSRTFRVRRLDRLDGRDLPGTENASSPFFSPDGRWIGFAQDGTLKKISVDGGPPVTLSTQPIALFGGGSWEGDEIVYSAGFALNRIPAAGGTATEVIAIDREAGEIAIGMPRHVPGADAVTYMFARAPGTVAIAVLRLDSGEHHVLREGASGATVLDSGDLIFMIDDVAYLAPFDRQTLQIAGEAIPVLQDVRLNTATPLLGVASNGTLAYVEGGDVQGATELAVLPLGGGSGETVTVPVRQGIFGYPRPSPDGRSIAYTVITEDVGRDLLIHDIERDVQMVFAAEGAVYAFEWSPDGEWIYFSAGVNELNGDIYRHRADTGGDRELVLDRETHDTVASISPDGEWMLVVGNRYPTAPDADIWLLSLQEGGEPQPLFADPVAGEISAKFSPDGRWIAWVSNESGDNEVYLTSFPNQRGRAKVSSIGGVQPVWSPDSRRLYYRTRGEIYGVDIDPDAGVTSSPFVVTTDPFQGALLQWEGSYAMAPEGDGFIVFRRPEGASGQAPRRGRILFVMNWLDELKRLAAGGR